MSALSRIGGLARDAWASFRKVELVVLVAGLLLVVGVWVFVAVAVEIAEPGGGGFDAWAMRALRDPDEPTKPWGPTWLREIGRDLTSLGSESVLATAVLLTAGGLLLAKKARAAAYVAGATVSGVLANAVLKAVFARERPDEAIRSVAVASSSFPSGHAMSAAIVYLTLGTFVARIVKGRALQLWVFGSCVALTFVVGLSRVYLGVHYPTDVVAGMAIGFAWAIGWWLVAEVLAGRAARRDGGDAPASLEPPRA